MNHIRYTHGDATQPEGLGAKIIVHICNDIGGWGAGFVLAISKRWKEPEKQYRIWHHNGGIDSSPFELGSVQFVPVTADIQVANLIGQHGIHRQGKTPPIRYAAVENGLIEVARKALDTAASVHMPRIGCGLAGGHWEEIEPLIIRQLVEKGVQVTVYDFVAS